MTITRNDTVFTIEKPINGSTKKLTSTASRKGRGMELSELLLVDDRLYAFCDVTGYIYYVNQTSNSVMAMSMVNFKNTDIPFKTEWATLGPNGKVYVGSIGKEWVVNGTTVHYHALSIYTVETPNIAAGYKNFVDWTTVYSDIRKFVNCSFPGYLQHEAVFWDPRSKNWLFLPRKASNLDPYDEIVDETKGTNIAILTNLDLAPLRHFEFGEFEPEWGFTSVRRLLRSDYYVAVKVREVNGETGSKLAVFDLDGKRVSEWYDLGSYKYEGLEILNYSM